MKTLRLKVPGREISIQRDTHGVPQITAASWLDALCGLGYVHLIDRGTQLLFARSLAQGRACEEIADQAELHETDRFFRRMGLFLDLQSEVELLDDRLQAELQAYCQGVNHALVSSGRTLPMWATGFRPQPWDPESVVLIGKLLSFGGLATSQLQNERLFIELVLAGVNESALRELFGDRLDGADLEAVRRVHMANRLSDEALELLTDLPKLAGSNAWAVAPQRSASGHALLASDPHLEINRLPAIWYEAKLVWPDRYVMGATLPGCPLFAVARTPELAWGVTYMKGDTADYFMEDCRPGGSTGWQYRRSDRWRDFDVRNEIIQHKGHAREALPVYSNPQGILETSPSADRPGIYLSVAWSGMHQGNGRAIGTWLDVVRSTSTAAAMQKARQCPQPTLCWVFADNRGHIGLQGCGRFPVRGNGNVGLAPIAAWDQRNHWQGWRHEDDLPSSYDPQAGFVATANEEIDGSNRPRLVTQPLPDYRLRRIHSRLDELPAATLEDMQQLQYDTISLRAQELLQVFLPFLDDSPLKQRLAAWDGSFDQDSTEAVLWVQFYRNVLVEVLGHDLGIGWRRMVYLCSRAGFSLMVVTGADRLLLSDDAEFWETRDKRALIRRAFEKLAASWQERPWSEINHFHFTDRYFGGHQVGQLLGYNTARYPMLGNHATIFQGHVLQTATRTTTFAPSYHFVCDLGTSEAWSNLPGGPSENRFSRYYRTDIARWLAGDYKPLRVDR